ncbi:aldehyde dehydrogenase 3, member A2 [Balamuthia mandrillaris]
MDASNSASTIVQSLRTTFREGKTLPLAWRREQLSALISLLTENKEQIMEALKEDLRQTILLAESEVDIPMKEAKLALSKLDEWTKPEPVSVPLLVKPGSGYIAKDPLGVVLIISPWNYPISLLLKPLVGAIAAGNCVVLKPSEVSAACSNVLANLLTKYMDQDCIRVVEGGVSETTALLKQKWDHIFYTGNGHVGRIVMKAASEHLTPVTLELGGKSPVVIDEHVNLEVAARRLCWAKFAMNVGQTCVAPDYILVTKSMEKPLLQQLAKTLHEFYGEDVRSSEDYSRMINQRHCQRVADLFKDREDVRVHYGGDVDVGERFIAPTILTDIQDPSSCPVMQEEIFGPVLPVIPVESVDEAIEFINQRDKPLALYVFSNDRNTQQKVLERTSSGGAAINEAVLHVVCPNLPFGGVGPSGMGAYNGRKTFDTFTHRKSVLARPTWSDPSIRYPPFTPSKIAWLKRLQGDGLLSGKKLLLVVALLAAPAVALFVHRYMNATSAARL